MDLCMCLPHPVFGYQTDRQYVSCFYKYLSHYFYIVNWLIVLKVPIIKLEMESPFDELEVDINCNNVPGIYNSHLLHYYARVDDRFPALCLLVKHWAINAGINDAMTGTFNSYSLILLVLHFLQCAVFPPVLPNLQALFPDQFNVSVDLNKLELFKDLRPLPSSSTVGELLIAFFDYYANFDFTQNAISVASGNIFPRSSLPPSCIRYKIFIEEPFDMQNTARCVTRIENLNLIQSAFSNARRALLSHKSKGPTLSSINVR
uniref:PAP-associated domain-containing protein n=1 Tax=Syphacia muris TaxID=451379 RepID=A0A0N5AGY9_9BILA